MSLLDLIWLAVVILLIGWVLGLFVFALGPLVHLLLVIVLVLIIVRLASGRRIT
jgi:hypothetical protein